MNLNTLSLYFYAGVLSLSLGVVLFVLARLRPGTHLLRSCGYTMLVFSGGFCVAAYGPFFPRWVTVIGTNVALLAAGAIFYSGVVAFLENRRSRVDLFGLGLLVVVGIAFWYWGLVEPNGNYRSAVFSIAAAMISGRTTRQLTPNLPWPWRSTPVLVLSALFGFLTVSMLARAAILVFTDLPPLPVRGINPTTWVTVFWFILLVTAMAACVVWAEFSRYQKNAAQDTYKSHAVFEWIEDSQSKLMLLWSLVLIAVLASASEAGLYYTKTYAVEQARLTRATELTNDALASRTKQAMSQIDTLLYAVRNFYLNSRSVAQTEVFINALPFDKTTIENVYLVSQRGDVVISHDPAAKNRSVADRDYYRFLKSNVADQVFIGSVEVGRINGLLNFRVARRISNPDGSFAGVILATVRPESFSMYHEKLSAGSQNVAVVLGISDKKIRARSPGIPFDQWQTPLESPLWDLLNHSTSGNYTNTSTVDHIQRVYAYKKVDDWPLVVATGFSESDLQDSVYEQLRSLAIAALAAFALVLILAILLTSEIRRRAEQGRFLSMLSHELKTPLATIAMTLGSAHIPDAIRLRVGRSIDSMNAVIERCLLSDRLTSGTVNVAVGACDVAALVADIRSACSDPQRVTIVAGDIVPLRTDQRIYSVIVSNLVDNALKYGAADSEVQVTMESSSQRGTAGVRVTVGNLAGAAGMPDPKRVFRKYYRAPGAGGKIGSGLGLYIANGFARKLGGQLRYVPFAEHVKFELWIPA